MEFLTESFLPPLGRGLLFAGIMLLGGAVAWRHFIAPGAARILLEQAGSEAGAGTMAHKMAHTMAPAPGMDGPIRDDPRARGSRPQGSLHAELSSLSPRVARFAALVSLVLLPAWLLRLQGQLASFRDPFVPLSEDLSFLVLETFWGWSWIAQGVLFLMLAGGFLLLGRRERAAPPPVLPRQVPGDPPPAVPFPRGWTLAGIGVLAVVATVALQSHAMGVPTNRWLAVTLDGAHTLAAGAWIGSLVLLLVAGRKGSGEVFAAQLRAFSPVAMVSVGVLVFAGFLLSTQHVMAWENLWGSPYGRMLLVKVGLAGGVMLLGAINWRRGLPTLDGEAGRRALRQRGWMEVGAAVAVLVATAILTGMPMPEGTH